MLSLTTAIAKAQRDGRRKLGLLAPASFLPFSTPGAAFAYGLVPAAIQVCH